MKTDYKVLVIGSGFGGLAAATYIAENGTSVLVVDENLHIGGQLLRTVSSKLGLDHGFHPDYVKRIGLRFIEKLKEQQIEVWNCSKVLGIYSGREVLIEKEDGQTTSLNPEFIIISSGARERFLPFKGWALPGVISTGMVQVLLKSYGVLPGKKMVIAGSGLFLFAVAYECLKHKLKPQTILEMSGFFDKTKLLPAILPFPSKIEEALRFMSGIFLNRVSYRPRWKVLEARGNGCLEEVLAVKVDGEGRAKSSATNIFKVDTLATGFGFVPNLELILEAGCKVEYEKDLGGWIASVNNDLETDRNGIFAVGEVTGIAGALKSIDEGKLAANAILYRLGKKNGSDYEKVKKILLKKRRKHLEFGKLFNGLYQIPRQAYLDIPDETVICRCEDVRMKDLRSIVKNGLKSFQEIKVISRATMGNCQGRTCAPIIIDLLTALVPDAESFEPLSARPPVKSVLLQNLANFEQTD